MLSDYTLLASAMLRSSQPNFPNPQSGKSENSDEELLSSEDETDEPTAFKPPFIMGECENESEDKRLSVAVLMPSGTCQRKKDHSVSICGDQ